MAAEAREIAVSEGKKKALMYCRNSTGNTWRIESLSSIGLTCTARHMVGSLEWQQPVWHAYLLDLLVLDRLREKL